MQPHYKKELLMSLISYLSYKNKVYKLDIIFCSGVLANGMSMGFSAIAIPDIKQEIMFKENSTSLFNPIETSMEELHWFGKTFCLNTYAWVYFFMFCIRIAIYVS